MKKIIYSLIGFVFLGLNYVSAMDVQKPVDQWLVWDKDPLDIAVQKIIWNATKFLSLIAVIYALWGWFLMLTAWWKDEQMKKWRTIIMQALIWLIVIWLANSIVSFVVNSLLWGWTWA